MNTSKNRHVIPGSERQPLAGAHAVGEGLTQRQYLSRDPYAAGHGTDPADIARVTAFASTHQLAVIESSTARRGAASWRPARSRP
jgi:hypothetical protein